MTGEEYYSAITKSCCCGTPQQDESKKCCDEESVILKLDTEYSYQQTAPEINPIFFAAFVSHFIIDSFPLASRNFNSYYLKTPPLPDREIFILVQSFLL